MAALPPSDWLTDALARGSISLAELAGLSNHELDLIDKLTQFRKELRFIEESTAILLGLLSLLALHPFDIAIGIASIHSYHRLLIHQTVILYQPF
ncbi:MAG: hypothetical protein VYA34_16635 [Myxococcota bacterium]|nr:hypothetical protein [Myxococcota bacterium]